VGYNAVADNTDLHYRLAVVFCLTNMQNPVEFSENSNIQQFKVIHLGVNRKRICNVLLVINSNFVRISYRFRDIDAFRSKIACFPIPPLFDAPYRRNALRYQRNLYTAGKYI